MNFDEQYFNENFLDVRRNNPKPGQIMARFSATADLVDGEMKRDVIRLLTTVDGGGNSAPNLMRRIGCSTEKDSYRVCREIAEDLSNGLSEEEVAEKFYRFSLEVFYYCKRECVPMDDPHWSVIQLLYREDVGKLIKDSGQGQTDAQPDNQTAQVSI